MYLVPGFEAVSRYPYPSTWVAGAIVDELETLAVECREAAADHGGHGTQRSAQSVRSLTQAAATCEEIVQMIRGEYLGAAVRRAPADRQNSPSAELHHLPTFADARGDDQVGSG